MSVSDARARTTLADPVAAAAAAAPDALALVDGELRLTWRAVDAAATAAARRLRAAGAAPDSRVAVLAGPSAAFVVLVHAARRAGAVLVPLAPRSTGAELAWSIAHARPKLLLQDGERAGTVAEAAAEAAAASSPSGITTRAMDVFVPLDPTAGPAADGRAPVALDPAATATILYTSGTTGRPKGAVLTWGDHLASAAAWASILDPRPSDRWLLALPVHHVAGVGTIVRAAVAGSAVVCAGEGFDADRVAALIARESITHLSVVATTLDRLLAALPGGHAIGSLRAVLLGGGPWPPELALRARHAGLPIVTTYGMTETASGVTALPADLLVDHPGSSGRALAGATVSVEVDGRPVPAGEAGEIVVSGPMVFAGYLDDPDATARALVDGRLRTGDVGSVDADGLLTVLDRRDDLVISGGENVYPAEVEAVLRAHPDVHDAGVVGVPDPRWGAVPIAVVVLRPGAAIDGEVLRAFARERLAGHKVPARIVVADAIPRTSSGKIVRRELRGLAAVARPEPALPMARPEPALPMATPEPALPATPAAASARVLQRDGAAVAYSVSGRGPGILLLHATLSRARAWLPIERRLATRATVVAIDRRGHAASPDPDPLRLTMADHVADAAAIVEREGIAPALVVGHSFGGNVALELAARRPELVAGVVAYEPPYLALASARVRTALARVSDATTAAHAAGDRPLAAETFLRAVLGDAGFDALPSGVRAAVLREGDAAASDARLAGLDPAGLSAIRVPVTIVVGEGSSGLYREVADALSTAIPGARVLTVPGADHMAPVTHPESILPIIEAALDAILPAAPHPTAHPAADPSVAPDPAA